MSRAAVARVFAVVLSAGCAGLVLGACGGSDRAAVRTITVTKDGKRVVTETSGDEEDDGESEDEDDEGLVGCLGGSPMEACRRVPGTEAECMAVRTETDAAIASTGDESQLAAARLARAVALMCLGERLEVAREDIEFARARSQELNEFSQETLSRIDLEDLPTGPGDVNEELFSGRADVGGTTTG